jgi:hypothetical protein
MTAPHDSTSVMTFRSHVSVSPSHRRLDGETAEGLIGGTVAPDDAPPAYSGVARLLEATRSVELAAGERPEPSSWRLITACFHSEIDLRGPAAPNTTSSWA